MQIHIKIATACAILLMMSGWFILMMPDDKSIIEGQQRGQPVSAHNDGRLPSRSSGDSRRLVHEYGDKTQGFGDEVPPASLLDPQDDGSNADASPGPPEGIDGLLMKDEAVLAAGGVILTPSEFGANTILPLTETSSMRAAAWQESANLMVNALREGDGFEVNHDELMDFLRGRDLLGWPEDLRNWIGDELMTALRQDMPQQAFGSLKAIEGDLSAPAAMRDYSVQHVSHLVAGAVIGREGVDFIWETLSENDPQTLSTALVCLQRLSEDVPDQVPIASVQAAAERFKDSPDDRTRTTASAILKIR
jgi:hypothetical protein